MTPDARTELAVHIEEAVRATPGVRAVFRSGSLISNLLRAGAAALGTRKDDEPIVAVVSSGDGVVVEASIGVDSDSRSEDILRAVQAEIDAILVERGVRRQSITLTVVHVQPREAA
ncbi:hypothetical protein [Microbacterium sp. Se63.02b]|uniref:hypothetical protein n=1 Tax=Microbacterium sp. Se63.02b TaxID=2709304 RepID=UPI0016054F88|nr:hypothetical protein [Microbacterium sp. Se63.02b]QNA91968.1 hypothetical protein G4G29_05130 [Microbacterium sp. Se63.02b]